MRKCYIFKIVQYLRSALCIGFIDNPQNFSFEMGYTEQVKFEEEIKIKM